MKSQNRTRKTASFTKEDNRRKQLKNQEAYEQMAATLSNIMRYALATQNFTQELH